MKEKGRIGKKLREGKGQTRSSDKIKPSFSYSNFSGKYNQFIFLYSSSEKKMKNYYNIHNTKIIDLIKKIYIFLLLNVTRMLKWST